MKIIHINGAGSWGGNEQQLTDLIPELEKLQVENMVMGRANAPLHQYCKQNNIPFIEAKDGKLTKKANYRYLKEVVNKEKPDVLHLHTSDSVTLFTISDILYKLRIPTVFSKKGIGNSMSFLSVFKYNYKNIDRIICVSEAVKVFMEKKVMKAKNRKKLIVVYDGINVTRLKPVRNENLKALFEIPSERILIGNIANHTAAKDLPTLLKMMNHLVYNLGMKNVHLVQIGQFSGLTEELKRLATELELNTYLTFTDFQKNATDFLPQFDVYVMSSEREGLPLTVYEAFYKRVAIVSTRAGGIPEVIEDGKNGYLADVRDFETLAKKVKLLLEDKEMQKQFQNESYNLLEENYKANKTAENMLEVYKNVVN